MIRFRRGPRLLLVIVALVGVSSGTAIAGTWGEGSFENDDALDWVATCTAAKSVSSVREVFERGVRAKYVEAPDAASVVAAAEAVAAARGKANPNLPAKFAAWIKSQPAPALVELTPLASQALVRVRDPKVSELRQLWDEAGPTKWLAAMANLESRLR